MSYKFLFLFFIAFATFNANSESRNGVIHRIYADPVDVVIVLVDAQGAPVNGECGTNYYHILRSAQNFKEFYSLILAAAASKKRLDLETGSCSNTRNILTHGSVVF